MEDMIGFYFCFVYMQTEIKGDKTSSEKFSFSYYFVS